MTKKAETRGPGRPSAYTDALAKEICSRLSMGEPLAIICRDDHMPTDRTVRNWGEQRDEFSSAIAHAREIGHDAIAVRTRLTARGKTPEEGGDSTGDVQRDKLIIETDLKLLSKWNPKAYGDRLAHVGGGPGDAPIRHQFGSLTDAELEERIARLTGGAGEPDAQP